MTRVLVVDDSAVARHLLGGILSSHGGFEVVGEATNGEEAVALAARLHPDVVTMDIRMPVMDGYEATRQIMAATPTPIVMVSAHEAGEVERSFNALAAGAVTVMPKPVGPGAPEYGRQAAELTRTLQAMAGLRLVTRRPAVPARPVTPAAERRERPRGEVVAIGASTGGPAALGQILRALPADYPVPILVVQHIAEGFDVGLANWLNSITGLTVRLAVDGEALRGGQVLIAPNGAHLGVTLGRRVELSEAPPIGAHRPAATHMFAAVARAYGSRGVGVILTGIGRDGTDGLAALKAAGGRVIGQDEASSVVYGMPRAAAEAGLVDEALPAADIAGAIRRLCRR